MALTVVLVLLGALIALTTLGTPSWGPGTHLEFAHRVLRRRKDLLPGPVAELIGDQRQAFLYGNLAADIINIKNFGGHYNHCHRWTIVREFQNTGKSPAVQAFALGYLAHLAADTIAHNHFVPYHLARYARHRGLGHLYWEMSADRFVPDSRWDLVTKLKADSELDLLDDLVNQAVPKKALSMKTNKLLFNHVLLISERESWRRGMAKIQPIGKVRLSRGFLDLFRKAATDRIRLAFTSRGMQRLEHIDTNGKAAQAEAMRIRRVLVKRHKAGEARLTAGEEAAQIFLTGMDSPPKNSHSATAPHWDG
ncbi:MAG: zinc dependent phospholipase C family protein [Planctomycetota bacterium]|nr:zinc dependent phospholipase C family protein [Planctomycetota bacterium]MDG2142931.1 zinc dependent phospholipase C family protein [Planctomycetota bacterium]